MAGVPVRGGRFLVTGGSGFIGSHLCDLLIRRGADSLAVFDAKIREENLREALASGLVSVIEGNILDSETLGRASEGVDGVFHLATRSLPECASDPRGGLETNVLGTLKVAEVAEEAGARKLVFSSASSVYGDSAVDLDEDSPLRPTSVYGATKAAAELVLRAYHEQRGLDYVSLRYMNVYGPRQDGGLVATTLRCVATGEPPLVAGDGTQELDFVHVQDVAAANLAAMEHTAANEVFNVGSGTGAVVGDIVAMLIELTGSALQPVFGTGEAPVARRVGSIRKAKELLEWHPKWDLGSGLRQLVGETAP